MSRRNVPTTVIAMVSAIFVTATVIIGVAFALSFSHFGGLGMSGTVEAGGEHVSTTKAGSSPLDLVPDPEDLGEGHVVGSTWEQQIIPSRPASDDDGELHNGWDDTVSYGVSEERYAKSEIRYSDTYDLNVSLDFNVTYPQLVDAGEHTDEVNEALRSAAMSFIDEYWDHPTDEAIKLVKGVTEVSDLGVPEDADALLANDVTWVVTYNTEDFISVSFSQDFCIGSWAGEYIRLRCVNANLKTGELYTFDDVLTMNEDLANRFVDVLTENAGTDENYDGVITENECYSVSVVGREEWIRALLGQGEFAHRVTPTFFIDEKGRVNLGVTYWMSSDSGFVRGWWDATLTDEQVAGARKESSMWDLIVPREDATGETTDEVVEDIVEDIVEETDVDEGAPEEVTEDFWEVVEIVSQEGEAVPEEGVGEVG